MFQPKIGVGPKPSNPFAYLEQMANYYQRGLRMPTLNQTTPDYSKRNPDPALKPFAPQLPALAFTPTTRVQQAGLTNTGPFPNMPPSTGPLSSTMQTFPTETLTQTDLTATLAPTLAQARIQNTLRQVPENLKDAWNTLGQDWWSQFSTWPQQYVNDFLTKYAAGDFAGANDVARNWYDLKAKYNREDAARQQEQDYFDQQSQYRQSARVV